MFRRIFNSLISLYHDGTERPVPAGAHGHMGMPFSRSQPEPATNVSGRRKTHRDYTLDELVDEYVTKREVYGGLIRTRNGLETHGLAWIRNHAKGRFNLGWNSFRLLAGYKDQIPGSMPATTAPVTEVLSHIRQMGGERVADAEWLDRLGFGCLLSYVSNEFDLGWKEFLDEHQNDVVRKHLQSQWRDTAPIVPNPPPSRLVECSPPGRDTALPARSNGTLEALKHEYRQIVSQHGDSARSSAWLQANGYTGLYLRVRAHGLGWPRFRRLCELGGGRKGLHGQTLDELIQSYKESREKRGGDASSATWLRKHDYCWPRYQAYQKHGLKWKQFKALCGYPDDYGSPVTLNAHTLNRAFREISEKHGEEAWAPDWLESNGYSCLAPYGNGMSPTSVPSKRAQVTQVSDEPEIRRSFDSIDDAMRFHIGLIKRYGNKALKTGWLQKHRYGRIYSEARRAGLRWKPYLLELGCRMKFQFSPEGRPPGEQKA